jgi:hypothetical protein
MKVASSLTYDPLFRSRQEALCGVPAEKGSICLESEPRGPVALVAMVQSLAGQESTPTGY